jgi:P4 family phage/plasmid primase-like protien
MADRVMTTLDLRTGIEREPRREDYITKITGCSLAPKGAECPVWGAFLRDVVGDDQDMVDYMQRVCGYCLTGSIKEHAMFFLYGTGGNGKSVFIGVLRGILGDYHTTAPIETFTAHHSSGHPTDLAGLMGARLLTAVETEEGRTWSEAKIKAITGGDEISARFMRQDFFTFVPKFKLMIAGNHKPSLRTVDEAIKRRLQLIPFNVKFEGKAVDKELPAKLEAEWPAILRWMVEGCRRDSTRRKRWLMRRTCISPTRIQSQHGLAIDAKLSQIMKTPPQTCSSRGKSGQSLWASRLGVADYDIRVSLQKATLKTGISKDAPKLEIDTPRLDMLQNTLLAKNGDMVEESNGCAISDDAYNANDATPVITLYN